MLKFLQTTNRSLAPLSLLVPVTRYGHMSTLTVHVGDEVVDGQLIGRIGSRGRSTGPHLRYEVHRYGQSLNPIKYSPRG